MKLGKITDYTIEYSFYLLFFLVPIIWLPVNYELFEFNKTILTYLLTIVITTAWIIKIFSEKSFIFKKTPLDKPILIFLLANIVATIFSLDPHTSIYGYYSRFNGGLLSILAYCLLYFALTNNLDKRKAKILLLVGLVSGFLVAFYGVLEHPNPLFATSENGQKVFHGIDYKYWAEAVETRVFSTLGQPNWLAAYLAMLLPASLTFMLIVKKVWQKLIFLIAGIVLFLATTFTLSRGGTFGMITAGVVFTLFLLVYRQPTLTKIKRFFHLKVGWPEVLEKNWLWLVGWLVAALLINSQFGNALALRGTTPNTPERPETKTGQSQLEIGGSQTGQIRLIVWKGAFDIFKHYPLTGTGVETFGYSYYLFRPAEHNLTAEWDYLYNKAHNEYLNYLANTGIIGFGSYILLIAAFVFWSINYLLKTQLNKERFLVLALFSGYAGYLVQNFFGFSVVIIALFFFLFPALTFVLTDSTSETNYLDKLIKEQTHNQTTNMFVRLITIALGLYCIGFVGRMWLADTYYALGSTVDNSTNYKNLKQAEAIFPNEPLYSAELAAAESGLAVEVDDEKQKLDLINDSYQRTKTLAKTHPNNTTIARSRLQTLFTLSQLDNKYLPETVAAATRLGEMAPSDASIQYNLALIYEAAEKHDQALTQIEKVLKLKPDYTEARDLEKKLRGG